MSVGILYPDAVLVAVTYLQAQLDADTTHDFADGATVRTREPNPFPVVAGAAGSGLTTVRRVGGADSVVIDRARLDLTTWHDNEQDCTDLANLLRAFMLAIPGVRSGVTVYRTTTFSGPALIWDTDRDLPRILQTFEVDMRGEAL
jgi:hypothetical protein